MYSILLFRLLGPPPQASKQIAGSVGPLWLCFAPPPRHRDAPATPFSVPFSLPPKNSPSKKKAPFSALSPTLARDPGGRPVPPPLPGPCQPSLSASYVSFTTLLFRGVRFLLLCLVPMRLILFLLMLNKPTTSPTHPPILDIFILWLFPTCISICCELEKNDELFPRKYEFADKWPVFPF